MWNTNFLSIPSLPVTIDNSRKELIITEAIMKTVLTYQCYYYKIFKETQLLYKKKHIA